MYTCTCIDSVPVSYIILPVNTYNLVHMQEQQNSDTISVQPSSNQEIIDSWTSTVTSKQLQVTSEDDLFQKQHPENTTCGSIQISEKIIWKHFSNM